MNQIQNTKRYDLEDRTLKFAENVRDFTKKIFNTAANAEYKKQIIRSSASVGANYIEANESFSSKDFIFRIKICRKEVKETIYWLRLIEIVNDVNLFLLRQKLVNEGIELMKIFGSIVSGHSFRI